MSEGLKDCFSAQRGSLDDEITFFLSNTDALPESLVQNNASGAHWRELPGAEDGRATRPGHSAVSSSE